MKDWYFSLFLAPIYIATFLLWQQFPSRSCFLWVGLVSAAVLTVGLLRAFKHQYFVDKADLLFHSLVIFDVILEGSFYEAARVTGYVTAGETELPFTLHSGNSFYGCAIGFALVLGFHRWRIMTANYTRHRTYQAF